MNVVGRLKRLWLSALRIGALGFMAGLVWLGSSQGPGLDWVWGIAVFGAPAILYNVAFFALCSMFVPKLSGLVEDDTEVQGDDVVHVVKFAETGEEPVDFYIRAYATARGTTAATIVGGVMIAVALAIF